MKSLVNNTRTTIHKASLGTFLVCLAPFSSIALAQTTPQLSPQFYCFPNSSGNLFTRVSVPDERSLNLIYWKNTPKPRLTCDQVSRKFQDFYEAGKLNYIKGGRSKKTFNAIICGTAEKNIECNEKSKLFDLLPYTKPAESLADDLKQRLLDFSGKPIYQGSDDELVINFQEVLAQLRNQKK